MFKSKSRKNRVEFLRSLKLRLENLEERQLLTAVGAFDVPYGPDPAPVLCTAAPDVDNSPAVDLSDVALSTTGETKTLWVTSTENDGAGSLRQVIVDADNGDTIKFNIEQDQDCVIQLESELKLGKSLTIDASDLSENGTPGVTIKIKNDFNARIIAVEKGADVVLNGLKLIGGTTTGVGGGIYLTGENSQLTTINTTISGNKTTGTSANGGGVYVGANTKYMSINTTISGNETTGTSANGGGVYVASNGTYLSTNTIIAGNKATNVGGGVAVKGTYTSLNTTITNNTSPNSGCGVRVLSGGCFNAFNSIIIGNQGTTSASDISPNDWNGAAYYTLSSLSYSDNFSQNNGNIKYTGNVIDLFNDFGGYDYSLKAGSAVIDAGNNDYVSGKVEGYTLVETDCVGNYRTRQGKDGSSQTVDMGAYEFVKSDCPAKIEVTTAADVVDTTDGVISFREAVQYAVDGDTIKFTSSETPQTISVTSTILLDKNITIDGTDAKVAFDGGNKNRIFNVASGKTVELKNLTLQNGKAGTDESPENGGAIYNEGNLTLTGVSATGNNATKNGGVAFNNSGATLTVSGGEFSGNSARNGGAFANYGETTISGVTTISNNSAERFGGAYFGCGTLEINGSTVDDKTTTFSGNTAGYKVEDDKTIVLFDGAKGGAIYNDVNGTAGTVSITGTVVFSENKATERGGAIMSYSNDAKTTTLTVKGETTFSGNEAEEYGGAIDVGQGCNALLGGKLTFDGNKATSDETDEGFGGAIFSVETLTFDAEGTYTFTGNTATKSGGAIDACDGTLTLAGKFTFSSNEAKGKYDDQTGLGGALATAAVTTVATETTFKWEGGNAAERGNCVALDSKISPKLSSVSFGLGTDPDDDYSTFKVIRPDNSVKQTSTLVPSTFAPNAVVATITVAGVPTTFGAEGVTPEQLGLDAGTHEALIQYADADGETSAVYSLVLTVDSSASLDVRETSFANGRGVKFDFNLTNADGRAVSVWEIAWGDGTTSRLEKLSTSWLAAHYYAQDGTFDVSLTVAYLDGTSETFEAFSTQTIGAAPVATTGKADALACVFAEPEDLFEELDDLIGPMPLR